MSDTFQKVLHNQDGLHIEFIDDADGVRVEFKANLAFDLSSEDDVVVVVNGQGVPVDCQSSDFAVAQIPDTDGPVSLMIRVHEFFEGWELG